MPTTSRTSNPSWTSTTRPAGCSSTIGTSTIWPSPTSPGRLPGRAPRRNLLRPPGPTVRGVALETVIVGLRHAHLEEQRRFGISSHLILCFLRHLSAEAAVETLRQALPYTGSASTSRNWLRTSRRKRGPSLEGFPNPLLARRPARGRRRGCRGRRGPRPGFRP
jgi:hypothetical protein